VSICCGCWLSWEDDKLDFVVDANAAAFEISWELLATFFGAAAEDVEEDEEDEGLRWFGGCMPWLPLAPAAAGWLLMGWLLLLTCSKQHVTNHLEAQALCRRRRVVLTVVAQKSKYRTASASREGHAAKALQNRNRASKRDTGRCNDEAGNLSRATKKYFAPECFEAKRLPKHAARFQILQPDTSNVPLDRLHGGWNGADVAQLARHYLNHLVAGHWKGSASTRIAGSGADDERAIVTVQLLCEAHAQTVAHILDLERCDDYLNAQIVDAGVIGRFTCALFAVLKPVLVHTVGPNNAGHGNGHGQLGKNQASLSYDTHAPSAMHANIHTYVTWHGASSACCWWGKCRVP
jgi:hypothetical protein